MRFKPLRVMTVALLFAWRPCPLRADVRLPALFSEHMVLTRGAAAPIWGRADAGEAVTVTLAGVRAQSQAGPDGRWLVRLDLSACGAGPFELVVKAKSQVTVGDVLVGSTWLASGQSNMEFPLKASLNAEAEIAHSANPRLRQFLVRKSASAEAADDCQGRWVLAGPDTSGEFTAVGYYFAKRLLQARNEPVGIINASWGGTYCEPWISRDAIDCVDSFKASDERQRKVVAEYPDKKKAFVVAFSKWLAENGREDRPCGDPSAFAADSAANAGWATVTLPGAVAGKDLPSGGAIWVRKQIQLPLSAIGRGQPFKVMIGHVSGFEQVYWNGKKVWETPYQRYPGTGYSTYFPVADELLRAGSNTIAVRIYAPVAAPRISIGSDAFKAGVVNMSGPWLAKAEYELPPLSKETAAAAPRPPDQPPGLLAGSIFNGMIHPLAPYPLAGVVWYQGESNTGRAYEYRIALPMLINDWRRRFGREDLPFYFCQLTNFGLKRNTPGESGWAELRESQSLTLKVPNTGQAVLIDLGESADIHARNKQDVGDRLARIALAKQYGQDIAFSGPVYRSMSIEGNAIRLKFEHTEGGLKAKPLPAAYDVISRTGEVAPLVRNSPRSELEGFAVSGEDHAWFWADAHIDGDTVVVCSTGVGHPTAVRYGWADNPTVNLENGAGLPASPFRTDDLPLLTAQGHY